MITITNNFDKKYATLFELMDILHVNLKNGPWIAGGAARKYFIGEPIIRKKTDDVDVFFGSKNQEDLARKQMGYFGKFSKVNVTNNSLTYFNGKENYSVQFIHKSFYSSVEELFASFDFSVCKIAMDPTSIILSDETLQDLKSNTLRFDPERSDVFENFPDRVKKYIDYGYVPVNKSFSKMLKKLPQRSLFNKNRFYFDNSGWVA